MMPTFRAADILQKVEEWASFGGKLHKAAEKIDTFVSKHKWTESKVKMTSTIVIDRSQQHNIEEFFAVAAGEVKVIKDLPTHLSSTGGEKDMLVASCELVSVDGSQTSLEKRPFNQIKDVVSLFSDPAVQKLRIHLRRPWRNHVNELLDFFLSSSGNQEGSQKAELREVVLVAKINRAMLLLLNQDQSQGEDGSIGAAEKLLLEVLEEIKSLDTPEQLEVRVGAVKDFFQVFSGRQLKMIEDAPDTNPIRVEYESWNRDGKGYVVRRAWSTCSKENPAHSLVDAFSISLGKALEDPDKKLVNEVSRLSSPDIDVALRYLMQRSGVKKVGVLELPSTWREMAKEMHWKPMPKRRELKEDPNPDISISQQKVVELLKAGHGQWHAFHGYESTDVHCIAKAAADMENDLCTLGKSCRIEDSVFMDLKQAATQMQSQGSDHEKAYRSSLNCIYKLSEHFGKDYADNLCRYIQMELDLGGHRTITDMILKDTSLFLKSPEIYSKLYLTKAHAFLVQGLIGSSQTCTNLVERRRESVPSTDDDDEWLERIKLCQAKAFKMKEEPSYYDQPAEWAYGTWSPCSIMGERCECNQPIYFRPSELCEDWRLVGGQRMTRYMLSIDGGGMKGIIPAVIASEIELRLHAPLSKVFHLFAGTSTGALLAAGLNIPRTGLEGGALSCQALCGFLDAPLTLRTLIGPERTSRLAASDIVTQYVFQGHTLFRKPTASGLAMQSMYSPDGIEAYLKKLTYVDDDLMRLSDTLADLMICATKQTERDAELVQWVSSDMQACWSYGMRYWASPKGAAEMYSLCDTTEAVHKQMLEISANTKSLAYYRCNPTLPRPFDLADTSGEGIAAMLDVAETFLQDAYASESNWFNKMLEKLGESIASIE
eukprot:Skav204052  [mRNA]  locus=scaffold3:278189:282667:- [translate_table: standard]